MSPVVVRSHEIIELVSAHPDGVMLGQLEQAVTRAFGSSVKYQTGSLLTLDLDDMLVFLEARDKVRIVGDVVFPCSTLSYAD